MGTGKNVGSTIENINSAYEGLMWTLTDYYAGKISYEGLRLNNNAVLEPVKRANIFYANALRVANSQSYNKQTKIATLTVSKTTFTVYRYIGSAVTVYDKDNGEPV